MGGLIGTIIYILVSALVFFFGYQIKVKRKISLIHSYHYKNVKEEDMAAYTSLVGISLYIIGIGMILCGILMFLSESLELFYFSDLAVTAINIIAIIAGLIVIHKAQMKYNGGWLS